MIQKKKTKEVNKNLLTLIILLVLLPVVVFVLLQTTGYKSKAADTGAILVGPTPNNTGIVYGNKPNVIKNISSGGAVKFRWACQLPVSGNRTCTDPFGKELKGEVTLEAGKSITLPISNDWGDRASTGMYELHYNVWVLSPLPSIPGAYDLTYDYFTPTEPCRVGYMFTRKTIANNYPNGGRIATNMSAPALGTYISARSLSSALLLTNLPVEMSTFNLYNNPLDVNKLNGMKALFISDGSTPRIERDVFISSAEKFTESEVASIKNKYLTGMDIMLVGENGQPKLENDEASISVRQIVNGLQNYLVYNNSVPMVSKVETVTTNKFAYGSPVPFLVGLKIYTKDSSYTPGEVYRTGTIASNPASCSYKANILSGSIAVKSSSTCLVSYLPPVTGGNGFMYIDANGGWPTSNQQNLANMLSFSCSRPK